MGTDVINADKVRKNINEHAFRELVKLVSDLNLRVGQELSQQLFQDCWEFIRAFPQFDIDKFLRRSRLEERWVNGWHKARRIGNEVEGYFDTEELPNTGYTVYFLMMAIASLDDCLQTRHTSRSVFAEATHQNEKRGVGNQVVFEHESGSAPVLGERSFTPELMPDGRSWDTMLSDDKDFAKCLLPRGRKLLESVGVITFRQLVVKTEAELLKIPWFGRKSLNQVREFLGHKRLRLDMEIDS